MPFRPVSAMSAQCSEPAVSASPSAAVTTPPVSSLSSLAAAPFPGSATSSYHHALSRAHRLQSSCRGLWGLVALQVALLPVLVAGLMSAQPHVVHQALMGVSPLLALAPQRHFALGLQHPAWRRTLKTSALVHGLGLAALCIARLLFLGPPAAPGLVWFVRMHAAALQLVLLLTDVALLVQAFQVRWHGARSVAGMATGLGKEAAHTAPARMMSGLNRQRRPMGHPFRCLPPLAPQAAKLSHTLSRRSISLPGEACEHESRVLGWHVCLPRLRL